MRWKNIITTQISIWNWQENFGDWENVLFLTIWYNEKTRKYDTILHKSYKVSKAIYFDTIDSMLLCDIMLCWLKNGNENMEVILIDKFLMDVFDPMYYDIYGGDSECNPEDERACTFWLLRSWRGCDIYDRSYRLNTNWWSDITDPGE